MTTDLFQQTAPEPTRTMGGKPVFEVPAKTVINFKSGFGHKLLCDSLTFTAGSACVYKCTFCYVEDLMAKNPHWASAQAAHPGVKFEDIVIRRRDTIDAIRKELVDRHGQSRYLAPMTDKVKPEDQRLFGPAVIYGSPLVDVAANLELARETVEIVKLFLTHTRWHIRLLSKSNLLPKIAQAIEKDMATDSAVRNARARVIYGVSSGTLDDKLAASFEQGTALVSKRIESLHWLQDNGYRTYGMICPSLPQDNYAKFAHEMCDALRVEKCEHVWGEVLNARGESFTRTESAIRSAGFEADADRFKHVCTDKVAWETYAQSTFHCLARELTESQGPDHTPKLRFLQYVTAETKPWWHARKNIGAILL